MALAELDVKCNMPSKSTISSLHHSLHDIDVLLFFIHVTRVPTSNEKCIFFNVIAGCLLPRCLDMLLDK